MSRGAEGVLASLRSRRSDHRLRWSLLVFATGGFLVLLALASLGASRGLDESVMWLLRGLSGPRLDALGWALAYTGYGWGVLPLDALIAAGLLVARRRKDAMFAFCALGGSLLLNTTLKNAIARARPQLWTPVEAHHTYSFPSGHAMATATLACVLCALAWGTRWRWPVTLAAVGFALLVGVSRVYVGVHFPTDIVAGWAAAVAWVIAMHLCVYRNNGAVIA